MHGLFRLKPSPPIFMQTKRTKKAGIVGKYGINLSTFIIVTHLFLLACELSSITVIDNSHCVIQVPDMVPV